MVGLVVNPSVATLKGVRKEHESPAMGDERARVGATHDSPCGMDYS